MCIRDRGGALVLHEGRTAIEQHGKRGQFAPGLRQDELDVVVKAGAHEVLQIATAQGQADKAGAGLLAREQLHMAGAEGMADTLDDGAGVTTEVAGLGKFIGETACDGLEC